MCESVHEYINYNRNVLRRNVLVCLQFSDVFLVVDEQTHLAKTDCCSRYSWKVFTIVVTCRPYMIITDKNASLKPVYTEQILDFLEKLVLFSLPRNNLTLKTSHIHDQWRGEYLRMVMRATNILVFAPHMSFVKIEPF